MIDALPSRRTEAWKYTDLRAALRDRDYALREGRDIIERLAPETQRMRVDAGQERLFVETLESAALEARAFEFDVGRGAALTRVVVQTSIAPSLSMARVRLDEGAVFRQFVYAEGAELTRIETQVVVAGSGAEVAMNGAYLVESGRHADLTSVISMQAPGCAARQLIKGAARSGGRGVFQGKIEVARAAQKTEARQYHHALMLDDGAEIDAKPELEIYADDVSCAHGNTCGGLDENAIFYVRSRGVPEAEARGLLTEAFLIEALPDWLAGDMRADIERRMRAWLGAKP